MTGNSNTLDAKLLSKPRLVWGHGGLISGGRFRGKNTEDRGDTMSGFSSFFEKSRGACIAKEKERGRK